MTSGTFFISQQTIRHLKDNAQRKISGVSSSHLSEAVAAALGFRTYAALRAKFGTNSTTEVQKPNNKRLVERLKDLGYGTVPEDLKVLPEFDLSYSPFKSLPLRTKHGIRWHGWRNLMVAAINAGLEQRLFGLQAGENWWVGGHEESQRCESVLFHFLFNSEIPAIVNLNVISGDELSISVVLNPKNPQNAPHSYSGLSEGDATAHGWVERRLGAWLQDGGEAFSCKRALLPQLSSLTIEPLGYSDQGSFIM